MFLSQMQTTNILQGIQLSQANTLEQKHTQMTSEQLDLFVKLQQQFGVVVSSKEAREIFKFNTPSSFGMALKRGHLKLSPRKVPGRRQHMFLTEEVAVQLAEWRQLKDSSEFK